MTGETTAARAPVRHIAIIAVLGFLLNLIYSVAVPPWMGPDEPRHVEYALLLVEKGRLVTWADPVPAIEQAIIRSMDRHDFWRYGMVSTGVYKPGVLPQRFDDIWSQGLTHELHQPPLYYLLQTPVVWLTRGMDIDVQLTLLRAVSALLAALTIVLTWLIAREALPDKPLVATAAACFVAFLPMHAFVGGIVNNDVLAEVVSTLAIYVMVRGLRRGFSLPLLAATLVVIVLGLLSKRTTVFAIPLLALALVLPLRWSVRRLSRKALAIAAVLGAGLLVAGSRALDWLAAHSARLPGPLQSLVYVYVVFLVRPSDTHAYGAAWGDFVTADAFAYYQRWVRTLFETFWARFGWANVRVDDRLYLLLALVSLAALAGALVVVWDALRTSGTGPRASKDAVLLFAGAVVFALAVLIVKMVREFDSVPRATTQARFLFPVIAPIAILFVLGLLRLAPERRHELVVRAGVAALLLLNAVSLLRVILPFYGLL